MNNTTYKKFSIESDLVMFDHRASVMGLLLCVQDTALKHTLELGVDRETIYKKNNAYWVLAKTRLNILKYPEYQDIIEVETYPLKPGLAKFEREAVIRLDGKIIGTMESLWCVVDANTLGIRRSLSIGYPDFTHRERALSSDYCSFRLPEMDESDYRFTHNVVLSDIDFNRHMNNVSYVKLALDTFGMDEYEESRIKSVETMYKEQVFYGEKLKIYRKDLDDGIYVCGTKEDGKHVFECRLT